MSTGTLLRLESIVLAEGAAPVTAEFRRRESWSVAGCAGSGKSRLISMIAGAEKPLSGRIKKSGKWIGPLAAKFKRKETPFSVALETAGQGRSSTATEALEILGLLDSGKEPILSLSTTQQSALSLLPAILELGDAVLLDGNLDSLDPWVLDRVLLTLKQRASEGRLVIVASNRPDVVESLDMILALHDCGTIYNGGVRSLISQFPPSETRIDSGDPEGLGSVLDSFDVRSELTEDGLLITSDLNLDQAAKLLVQGYGNVRNILVRPLTVWEALAHLRDRAR